MNASPQSMGWKDQVNFDPNSTQTLLTAVNHLILNTDQDMIQSKIRELMVGTELEEIAKSAQIVIHIHDDAKEYLHQQL